MNTNPPPCSSPSKGNTRWKIWIWRRRNIDRMYAAQGGRCTYCHQIMTKKLSPDGKQPPNHATLDHLIPRSREGKGGNSNLALACHSCNSAKGNRTADEYRASLATVNTPGATTP